MKAIFIVMAVLVAGISAWPEGTYTAPDIQKDRIAAGIITSTINRISQRMKDRGLDPLYIENFESSHTSLIPNLFSYSKTLKEILVEGLSDIVVNDITISLFRSSISFDISLPRISSSVGYAASEVSGLGKSFSSSTNGSLLITNTRISGNFRFRIGLISGFQIRELKFALNVEDIKPDIYLNIQGEDLSDRINEVLKKVPESLVIFNEEIAPILEFIIIRFINDLL